MRLWGVRRILGWLRVSDKPRAVESWWLVWLGVSDKPQVVESWWLLRGVVKGVLRQEGGLRREGVARQ